MLFTFTTTTGSLLSSLLPLSYDYFYQILTFDAFFDIVTIIFYFCILMLDVLSLCNGNTISFHLEFCPALIFLLPFHIYCFYGYLRCSIDRVLCPFVLLATAVLAFDHVLGLTKLGYDLPTLKVLLLAVQNLNHAICHLLYLEVCLVLILHSLWFLLIYL